MCSTTAKNAASPSPNPSRRTRTKTRKPKFVSLRRDFSPESEIAGDMNQLQLNLFPLHPENLFGEKETHDHVDYFFESENGGGATLNGLLAAGPCPSSSSSEEPLSSSLTYAYDRHDGDGTGSLARAALRRKERDTSEEKWVAYSDVATREKEEGARDVRYRAPGLSLKLDYQEILNSWSDKSPLYIDGEGTQIVPNLDEIHAHDSNTVYTTSLELGGCTKDGRGVWTVPDSGSVAEGGGVEGKMSGREARVLRYKEKRQSRLFSKRIRYEVRKLNAEKRPRMKGRFVKRKLQA